jgi:aspartyl protease family protein
MKIAGNRSFLSTGISLIAALPMLISVGLPYEAKAQDPGNCFMVNSSGRTVSLGKLCGTSSPTPGVFRVPIKRRLAKTPVIDVTFNGNQTFEMILDTGASATLITQKMAKALNIQPKRAVRAQMADGREVQFVTTQVESISVSGAVVNNVEVAIAPQADIGLLGHDFLDGYDVKIRENVVEFHRR